MLNHLHAKNKHPSRSNHLGEMNQKPKKEILTLTHPCVAVQQSDANIHSHFNLLILRKQN